MSPRNEDDVVVVGAGPAGAALAAFLAKAGRSVTLLEKGTFPRDKLCGEFLSPESQSVLAELGCLTALKNAGAPAIHRARFSCTTGRSLRVNLPGEGLGVSRHLLDALLFERARAYGVRCHTKIEVTSVVPKGAQLEVQFSARGPQGNTESGEIRAGWVIGAHGRRSRLDRGLKRSFWGQRHPYAGLKRHHRPADSGAGRRLTAELSDHVEIHAFEGGYCGMSFIETGEVNVCMLLESRAIEGLSAVTWDTVKASLLHQNPRLHRRLEALDPTDSKALAVAEVPFCFKSQMEGGVLFVGDAAGMIAPLAGDGQAMALSSAQMLAHLLWSAPRRPSVQARRRLAFRYQWAWRRRYEARMRLSRWLQGKLLQSKRADQVIAAVSVVPGAPDVLARWTRG